MSEIETSLIGRMVMHWGAVHTVVWARADPHGGIPWFGLADPSGTITEAMINGAQLLPWPAADDNPAEV